LDFHSTVRTAAFAKAEAVPRCHACELLSRECLRRATLP
jgi:hypothetical protein